jgi:hypothetical protein
MAFGNLAGNGQAKARMFAKGGLAFFPGTGWAVSVEAIEDALQGFFWNTGAFIFNRDPDYLSVPRAE